MPPSKMRELRHEVTKLAFAANVMGFDWLPGARFLKSIHLTKHGTLLYLYEPGPSEHLLLSVCGLFAKE